DLETINGNQYLICDSGDPIQSKVCHLYCRGQFAESGKCVRENNLPICKCSSETGSSTTDSSVTTQTIQSTTISQTNPLISSIKYILSIGQIFKKKRKFTLKIFKKNQSTSNISTIHFNGTVKLNISISNGFLRIFPLSNGDLVRGSIRNLIEIWDLQKGIIKKKLTSEYSYPFVFGLLSNGNLVAGYYTNRVLVIWDLEKSNDEILKRTIQLNETFYCLTVLKNDDLAIGQDGNDGNGFNIIIRNSRNGSIKKKLVGHTSVVNQIIELPNGNLVSCSDDKTVKVWNISNGTVIKTMTHTSLVYSIAVLNNGYLASGLSDGTIKIWNVETNQMVRNLTGHSSIICYHNCLHVLQDGYLLSGSHDDTMKVWDPSDGTIELSLLHKSSVRQIAVLPSGNYISSSHYEIIVWN
ncbi:WD40 repeat-containing, partial [Brachionus plicatilis]